MKMQEKDESSEVFVADGSKKEKEETLREKLKDGVYRKRVLHSCWLAVSSFTLGIIFGQQGPSFLDLQIITDTDVESASFFFTAASFGYMVGSFLSGFVHGKVNNNVLMCVINAGAGLAAIITPYCSLYPLMIIIRFVTNMFCGGIDTLVGAEHMRLWGKDGRALLQVIHFTFAVGGMVCPLFTEPFLAAKFTGNGTSSVILSVNSSHTTNMFYEEIYPTNLTVEQQSWNLTLEQQLRNLTADQHLANLTMQQQTRPKTTNIHYAFLIGGLIAVTTAIPFIFLIFIDRTDKSSKEEKYTQQEHSRKLPLPLYVFMLVVLCFFYVVYCCIEDTFASFLMTFVVSEYDWVSKSKGAYITMFYWVSFAAARFGSIFVSRYLTAVRLLYLYLFLMVISYVGFTISATYAAVDALTAFACMAGISMSAVFPAGFSWTEAELFKVTGWVSSFILIGGSLGMMVNPMIIGYLMKHVSNMWFCYILLGESFLLFAVFMFLLLFNRCYVNKKYGTVESIAGMEVKVDPPKELESVPMTNGGEDASRT